MNKYRKFFQAVIMNFTIKSPKDMIDLLIRSIKISNRQLYMNILSHEEEYQNFNRQTQCTKQQQQHYNRKDKHQLSMSDLRLWSLAKGSCLYMHNNMYSNSYP